MASIRANGTGTYSVLFRQGGRQTSQTFETSQKAEDFRQLVNVLGPDRALKALDVRADERLTVGELAEKFLDWKRTGPKKVTDRTWKDYRRDVDNYILPWFGHRAAEVIDEADVQQWVDHMAKTLAPKSVAARHMLLHSIYAYGCARSRHLVTHNPCLETALPDPGRKRPKGTKVPQWRAILDAAHERNTDAEDLIRYLGTVGWRFSEAIALPVSEVDDRRNGSLWVDMTQVFRMVDGKQVLVPDEAKTYAGFRCVRVMSDDTAAMIRRRIVGKAPTDLVFTNSAGRHWNQQTFLRETWPGILADAGLWQGAKKSPTPHWLRHMAVAVLAAAGVSPQDIQRYLGHRELSTTMGTYGGLLGGITADQAANVDAILSGRGPAGPIVVGEVVEQTLELGQTAAAVSSQATGG